MQRLLSTAVPIFPSLPYRCRSRMYNSAAKEPHSTQLDIPKALPTPSLRDIFHPDTCHLLRLPCRTRFAATQEVRLWIKIWKRVTQPRLGKTATPPWQKSKARASASMPPSRDISAHTATKAAKKTSPITRMRMTISAGDSSGRLLQAKAVKTPQVVTRRPTLGSKRILTLVSVPLKSETCGR